MTLEDSKAVALLDKFPVFLRQLSCLVLLPRLWLGLFFWQRMNNERNRLTFTIGHAHTVPMVDETRTKILEAARRRFAHYGYGKTTMAEIARDCAMSVGNLYRFYASKEEIAVAGAEYCLCEKAEAAEAAISDSASAFEQLHAFMLARLRYMHDFVSDTPHMQELVQLVSSRHGDMLRRFERRGIDCIADILQEGMSAGEFHPANAHKLAADIYNATNKYNLPMCMNAPLAELEAELESMLGLLGQALRSRGMEP